MKKCFVILAVLVSIVLIDAASAAPGDMVMVHKSSSNGAYLRRLDPNGVVTFTSSHYGNPPTTGPVINPTTKLATFSLANNYVFWWDSADNFLGNYDVVGPVRGMTADTNGNTYVLRENTSGNVLLQAFDL